MESPDVSKVPNDGSIVRLRRDYELDESDAKRAFRFRTRVGCCGANRIESRHNRIAADRLGSRYPETEANALTGAIAPRPRWARFTSGPDSTRRSRPAR
jgi:hypothetical protein